MDAAIARRLWRAIVVWDVKTGTAQLVRQGDRAKIPLPGYSTDVAESHRVIRFMQAKGFTARVRSVPELGKFRASFTMNDGRIYLMSESETMPMAICLAALAAIDNKNTLPN